MAFRPVRPAALVTSAASGGTRRAAGMPAPDEAPLMTGSGQFTYRIRR